MALTENAIISQNGKCGRSPENLRINATTMPRNPKP
jgi:hypothetical protein